MDHFHRRTGLQGVSHVSGYWVGIHDRESIDYRDATRSLRFAMDVGGTVGIYEDGVLDLATGRDAAIDPAALDDLKRRIGGACEFLGMRVEWCRSLPLGEPDIHRRTD